MNVSLTKLSELLHLDHSHRPVETATPEPGLVHCRVLCHLENILGGVHVQCVYQCNGKRIREGFKNSSSAN